MSKSIVVDCTSHEHDEQNRASLGETLANARQLVGMSIDDVAAKLFLSPAVVSQIENDTIPGSSNTLFSKGYVKSYCALLELPADEPIRLFELQYQCNNDVKKMQTFSNRSKNTTHNNYLNWITLIVICVMVIGVVAWWWQQGQQEVPVVAAVENLSQNIEPSPRLPLTPEMSVTSITPSTTLIYTTISFTQDCWVKITDATNAVIAVGIKKAGSNIELSGVAPLEIVLGAPSGVEITYEQQKIDISPYISNDTATFSLPLEQ